MSSRLDHLQRQAAQLQSDTWAEFWTVVVECGSLLSTLRPNQRRPWLNRVVAELYEQQNGICALGGEPLELGSLTVDHKIPFCYGGGNERSNIQLACLKHNQEKGHRGIAPRELLSYLEDKYMNR
jgi:5-methylcytosine-specific restriction endonuclease McrA